MSGLKDIAKGGWHPKGKDGKSKESWRGDYKGINQVAGWMGKGKDPSAEANDHISRPLSSLKDPAAFGPPPKHVDYYGPSPDTGGPGVRQRAEEEEEEAAKPKPPPVPYRADTTGLSTSHLPPPPGRTDGADGRTPPTVGSKPKPSLPPRLPPRQNSDRTTSPPSAEPDAHKGILNQGSLSRLASAGVSVPEFGIGGTKGRPPLPPPSPDISSRTSTPAASPGASSQLNELQSRFSRLSSTSPNPETPSEGTTFAQKQAALKTASAFRNDPSSVSLSDAKAAASTANNFRERHSDQVKSGWQSANKLNMKYGIADKVGAYGGVANAQTSKPSSPPLEARENITGVPANSASGLGALGKKKPPPPPPAKKANLAGIGVPRDAASPPPIPLSTRPKLLVSSNG